MLKKRIIPCLDVKGGRVVKGIKFVNGRDSSSFDKMFTDINDKNYFINAFKALDAYNSTSTTVAATTAAH